MHILSKRTIVASVLAGIASGCSTTPKKSVRWTHVPFGEASEHMEEIVPQSEPPSRSGNAPIYSVLGKRYHVLATSAGFAEEGVASYYGWEFHGKKTSSGLPFNAFDLTAAHKSLPIPCYVRVTNLDNGRSTVVKVTDRGPFANDRAIDLSYAAAERLGMLEKGTAFVEIVALEPYQSLPDATDTAIAAARESGKRRARSGRALAAAATNAVNAPARKIVVMRPTNVARAEIPMIRKPAPAQVASAPEKTLEPSTTRLQVATAPTEHNAN